MSGPEQAYCSDCAWPYECAAAKSCTRRDRGEVRSVYLEYGPEPETPDEDFRIDPGVLRHGSGSGLPLSSSSDYGDCWAYAHFVADDRETLTYELDNGGLHTVFEDMDGVWRRLDLGEDEDRTVEVTFDISGEEMTVIDFVARSRQMGRRAFNETPPPDCPRPPPPPAPPPLGGRARSGSGPRPAGPSAGAADGSRSGLRPATDFDAMTSAPDFIAAFHEGRRAVCAMLGIPFRVLRAGLDVPRSSFDFAQDERGGSRSPERTAAWFDFAHHAADEMAVEGRSPEPAPCEAPADTGDPLPPWRRRIAENMIKRAPARHEQGDGAAAPAQAGNAASAPSEGRQEPSSPERDPSRSEAQRGSDQDA